jgi:hypothetical protein
MEDTDCWVLITKYLTSEASKEEVEKLKSLMESDPGYRQLFDEASRLWGATKGRSRIRLDIAAAWGRLLARIDANEVGFNS